MSPVISLEVSVVGNCIYSAKQYCCRRGTLCRQNQEKRQEPGNQGPHSAIVVLGAQLVPCHLHLICLFIHGLSGSARSEGSQEFAGTAGHPRHGGWPGQGPGRGTGRVQCQQTNGQVTPAPVDGQRNGVTSRVQSGARAATAGAQPCSL